MSIADKIIRAKNDYDIVYEAGKKAERDAFWDVYLADSSFDNHFAGTGWTNETFRPNRDIIPTSAYMMFRGSNIQGDLVEILNDLEIKLDFSKCNSLQYTFQSTKFTRIGEIKAMYNFLDTFGSSTLLKTIDKIIIVKTLTFNNNTFYNCSALTNITFEGEITSNINFQWCPLTKASITSVINALSLSATGQTATFKKSAKEAAFTDSEWAELIATRPNWTIALV